MSIHWRLLRDSSRSALNSLPAFHSGHFPELASEHQVPLLPSLLENVAGVSGLNQEDGKHPNARGARVLAGNVFRALEPLLPPPNPERDR